MVHSIVLWDGGGIRETKEKKPKRLPKNKEMGLFFWCGSRERKRRVSNFVARIGVASVSRAQPVVPGHLVKHINETLYRRWTKALSQLLDHTQRV